MAYGDRNEYQSNNELRESVLKSDSTQKTGEIFMVFENEKH